MKFADTLQVHDLDHTIGGQKNQQYTPEVNTNLQPLTPGTSKDMIQNVNFDIDNFINNAKIIQDSINEAMAYNTELDPVQKEEMFRSDLKTRVNN